VNSALHSGNKGVIDTPIPRCYDSAMSKPDIHQLEERVLALMEEFRRLKEQNQGLSRQVDQLSREKAALREEQNLSKGAQDRLSQLEFKTKKNEKDRKVIQAKVRTILQNLEKFDLT